MAASALAFNATPMHYPEFIEGALLLVVGVLLWRARDRVVKVRTLAVFVAGVGLGALRPLLTGDDPLKPLLMVMGDLAMATAGVAFVIFAWAIHRRWPTAREWLVAIALPAACTAALVAWHLIHITPRTYATFRAPPLEYPELAARIVSFDVANYLVQGAIFAGLALLALRWAEMRPAERRLVGWMAVGLTLYIGRYWAFTIMGVNATRVGQIPIAWVGVLSLALAWLLASYSPSIQVGSSPRNLAWWTLGATLLCMLLFRAFPFDGHLAYWHAVAWRAIPPGAILGTAMVALSDVGRVAPSAGPLEKGTAPVVR